MNESNVQELKIATRSPTPQVAGAIAGYLREGKEIVLVAIGAGAVNQAVKATAAANGLIASQGIRLALLPGFRTEIINGQEKTAIRMKIIKT